MRKIAIPKERKSGFCQRRLLKEAKRSWRKTARHPAILAPVLALLVIAGLAVYLFVERLQEFRGRRSPEAALVANSTPKRSSSRYAPMPSISAIIFS